MPRGQHLGQGSELRRAWLEAMRLSPRRAPRVEWLRRSIALRREALRDQELWLESLDTIIANVGRLWDVDAPIENGQARGTQRQFLDAIFAAVPEEELTADGYPTLLDVNEHLSDRGFDQIDRVTLRREYDRWRRSG